MLRKAREVGSGVARHDFIGRMVLLDDDQHMRIGRHHELSRHAVRLRLRHRACACEQGGCQRRDCARQRFEDNHTFLNCCSARGIELAARFNVSGIPNFVLLKSGQVVDQRAGALRHSQLRAMVERSL